MLTSSIWYMILRTFPESIVIIFCGTLLMGIKISKKELIKTGFLFGCIVIIIRSLPINFGVHTILSMIALGIILYRKSNGDLLRVVISTCIFFISIALSEAIYVIMATNILGISMQTLTNKDGILAAIVTLPSLLIAIALVLIFKKLIIEKVERYIKRENNG